LSIVLAATGCLLNLLFTFVIFFLFLFQNTKYHLQKSSMATSVDLSTLQTEARNPRSIAIDRLCTLELCQIICNEDATVPRAVQSCIPIIAEAVDALQPRIRRGGKLFYVGAGTSGRLGVLDASELPPTYSASPKQFVALIAGGDIALRHAQEGAEDNVLAAENDLKANQIDGDCDSLIGIAASGRTPYVLRCLEYANSLGCTTVGIACSSPSAMSKSESVDYMIEAVTGPEVVTGSTRMKSGTATKLILNMISTAIMVKIGKTFGNMVINSRPANVTRSDLWTDGRSPCHKSQVKTALTQHPSRALWASVPELR
jgi:N-acetylmuramic acid 6-phosphate etherase